MGSVGVGGEYYMYVYEQEGVAKRGYVHYK